MKSINPDNVFGSRGFASSAGEILTKQEHSREPFVNRPTKGKTSRKRKFLPNGKKTNVGDPMKGQSIGQKGKG